MRAQFSVAFRFSFKQRHEKPEQLTNPNKPGLALPEVDGPVKAKGLQGSWNFEFGMALALSEQCRALGPRGCAGVGVTGLQG